MEYNPLKYIQEGITDEELTQIIFHKKIKEFCLALTIDLYIENHQKMCLT